MMNVYNPKLLIKFAKAGKARSQLFFSQRDHTHGWLTDGHAAYRVYGGFSALPDAVRALFPVTQLFSGTPLQYCWCLGRNYVESIGEDMCVNPEKLENSQGSDKLRVEPHLVQLCGCSRRLWEFEPKSGATWGFWHTIVPEDAQEAVPENVQEPVCLIFDKALTDVLEEGLASTLTRSIGSNTTTAPLRWYDSDGIMVGIACGIRP